MEKNENYIVHKPKQNFNYFFPQFHTHSIHPNSRRPALPLFPDPLAAAGLLAVTLIGAGSPEFILSGKFSSARAPLIPYAALSYARAASSAVSYVPSHTRDPFLAGSLISAANRPHGRRLTPLYRRHPASASDSRGGPAGDGFSNIISGGGGAESSIKYARMASRRATLASDSNILRTLLLGVFKFGGIN
ncbi:1-deoxy-D-xylulose 5-phosphate reductoisomerase [Striga asiatica]|uniref:1-deoxy-D-xylulose 5-phosphate reductoisomerase n=1 Tax=Striga asiatica TaxID=4170 RepID=A0A5A7PPN2_STRAF|nr:1-deoxy-D-xylulose 5-phosphate reductoisomerase [Striga asiatica]